MKRLLIVLILTLAAAGCQVFRRPTTTCAPTGMVYEAAPCEDGGAYLGAPQILPGP